jgi:hypothetical protein
MLVADELSHHGASPRAPESAMRVLHVIDPHSPGGGACTLRLLSDFIAATEHWEHVVAIAGHADHVALARRCGVSAIGSVPRIGASLASRPAAQALRSILNVYERAHGQFDLIQAWTIWSAAMARRATSRTPVLAMIQVGPCDDAECRALRECAFSGGTLIAATSSSAASDCLGAGIPGAHVLTLSAGVNVQRAAQRSRAAIRRRWHVRDQEFLVGLCTQPSAWSDVRMALAIVAPLMAVPHPIRLVAFPGAGRRIQAMRWLRRLNWPDHIILDDDLAEPWRVMPGLDVVLALGGMRGTRSNAATLAANGTANEFANRPAMGVLPILHAMAAGLPVITDISSDELDVVVDEGRSGFRLYPNDISAAMERVLRLMTDSALRRRMGIAAREAVMSHASIERFASRVSAAAGQLVLAATR